MNKILKILAALIAAAGIFVLVVFIAAKIIITPERVREAVIPRAEAALNRPVSIGDIRINIFSGIGIKNFAVKSQNGKETFIAASALVLRYQFWPLLKKRIVLDEARLESPEIRVVRFENGDFNFSDLLKTKPQPEKAPQPSPGPGGGPSFDFNVNQMRISNGRLDFIDHSAGPGEHAYHLTQLNLSADQISLQQAFPFEFEVQLNGAPISIKGTFNPDTLNGKAHVTGKNLDVNQFAPYLAGKVPGKLESMTLDLDINVSREGNTLSSSGKIKAGRINLALDAMPEAPIQNGRLGLTFDGAVDTGSENIRINQAKADINGIPLQMSGTIAAYKTRPVLDLHAVLPPTGMDVLLSALPQKLLGAYGQMNPEGRIGAEFQLAGSPDRIQTLVQQGEIRLDSIRATYNGLRAGLNGRVQFKGDSAVGENIVIGLDEQTARLDFKAENLTGKPIRITQKLTSDALNLDKITAAMGGGAKAPPEKKPPGKTGPAPPSEPMNLPMVADGTVRVANAVYQGLNVTDFALLYHLENNILNINEISMQVAGGTIKGKGRIDLGQADMGYNADVSVDGTQTDDLVSALFPKAANTIFGNLFLNAKLSGSGIDLSGIQKSLTAQADMRVTEGKLTGIGLTRGLAAFLNAQSLQVLNFDAVKGNIRLNNGKFVLDTDYNSKDLRMNPTGTIGLDGSIDLSLNMRLAPEIAARIKGNQLVSQVLTDQEGWALLPLDVAGSLKDPRFALDTTVVQKQLKEKATQKLQEQIREKLFKQSAPKQQEGQKPAPPEQKGQPPLDKMLEDTLKNIF